MALAPEKAADETRHFAQSGRRSAAADAVTAADLAANLAVDRTLPWPPRADFWRGWTTAAAATISLWAERSRTRRTLAALDDDRLLDIGVSRADARRESAKPFWVP